MDSEENIFGKIILFCAEWCVHSNKMLPEWQKFEEYAKTNFIKLEIKKINYDTDQHKIYKNILAFPTIMLFQDNQEILYDGNRSMKSFIDFINMNGYEQFLQTIEKQKEQNKQNNNVNDEDQEIIINIDI